MLLVAGKRQAATRGTARDLSAESYRNRKLHVFWRFCQFRNYLTLYSFWQIFRVMGKNRKKGKLISNPDYEITAGCALYFHRIQLFLYRFIIHLISPNLTATACGPTKKCRRPPRTAENRRRPFDRRGLVWPRKRSFLCVFLKWFFFLQIFSL